MKKGAHAAATVGLPLRTLPCLPGWLVTQLQTALSAKRLSRKKKRPPRRPLGSRPRARARCDPMQEVDAGRRDGVGSRGG